MNTVAVRLTTEQAAWIEKIRTAWNRKVPLAIITQSSVLRVIISTILAAYKKDIERGDISKKRQLKMPQQKNPD